MEERKRNVLAVIIACVVMLALVYSFGLNLFYRTPDFQLADPTVTESGSPGASDPGDVSGVTVDVTPATVQSVIASLTKYSSYSRSVSVTYRWDGESSGTLSAQVWADGGWVYTETALPTGLTECSVVGEGAIWIWYAEDPENVRSNVRVYTGSAQTGAEDLTQRIPTYEDVLALDPEEISSAGYELWEGQSCVYVETTPDELGCVRRFWVSESSGLLMAAQTEQEGLIVYEMSSGAVMSPMEQGTRAFTLPAGTTLHSVD